MKGTLAGGKYKIGQFIGEGRFSKVYDAHHSALNKKVAIKELKEDLRKDKRALERFKNEAQMIARLEHPNIVKIYDFFEHDYYFVMSRLYRPLDLEIRRTKGFSFPRALGFSLDLAKALEFLSEKNIIHRDIKPSNIMFTKEEKGRAVLTDFGIAVKMGTPLKGAAGTPEYASPEQIKVEPVDQRSDMYSFGVVLYMIVTGRVPFSGEDFDEIIQKHTTQKLVPPSKIVGSIDQQFEGIILRLLQFDRKDRYPSVVALSDELNEVKNRYRDTVFDRAERYESEGKIILAINELDSYLEDVDPDDTEIVKKRGRIQKIQYISNAEHALKRGDVSKAKGEIECARSFDIRDGVLEDKEYTVEARIRKAEELTEDAKKLLETKRFEAAKEKFQELQNVEPENYDINKYIESCESLVEAFENKKKKDYQSALQKLRNAKESFPDVLYIEDEMKQIEKVVQELEHLVDEHNDLVKTYTENLPISKLGSELEKVKESNVLFDNTAQDELKQIYCQIHFAIAEILLKDGEPDVESIKLQLRQALNDDPEFLPAKIKMALVEVMAENYQAAKMIYHDLTPVDSTFNTNLELMTLLSAASKKSRNRHYDEALSALNEASRTLDEEQAHHASIIGEKIQKIRQQIEDKQKMKHIDETQIEHTPLPSGRKPERMGREKTITEPIEEVKKSRVKRACILIPAAVVVLFCLVYLLFFNKPGVTPEDTKAHQHALAFDDDGEKSIDEKIRVWKDFGVDYPTSQWIQQAQERLRYWGEAAYQQAQRIDADSTASDDEKLGAWKYFIELCESLVQDSLVGSRIDSANERLNYYQAILVDPGKGKAEEAFAHAQAVDQDPARSPQEKIGMWQELQREYSSSPYVSEAEKRIRFWTGELGKKAYILAQEADQDPMRSPQEKIGMWQKFVKDYPSSANVSRAKKRILFWRSEIVFNDTYSLDRDEGASPQEKSAAWSAFIENYPSSERVGEAEERIRYWAMVFIEDFENNDHGWPQNSSKDVTNYTDLGDYTVFYSTTARMTTYNDAQDYGNFELRTSVRYSSGENTQMFGIAFRIKDHGNFYIFGISGDGRYSFRKKVDYETYSISGGESNAIHQEKGAVNSIRFLVDTHRFEFYINGVFVAGREDESIDSGKIGFYVEPRVMVHFDYLNVVPFTK